MSMPMFAAEKPALACAAVIAEPLYFSVPVAGIEVMITFPSGSLGSPGSE